MAWSMFTVDQMDRISRQLFMPLVLLVNYTLLQYLLGFYWARRNERRIRLLFAIAGLGVLCLIPFANPNDTLVGHLNDVSELCSVVTFLIQITVIGYDLNKKIKFKTVRYLTYVAELLILADIVMVVLSFVLVLDEDFVSPETWEFLLRICTNSTLAFIFFFRYYYIVASRGWSDVLNNRKLEVVWYFLFATDDILFIVLERVSGLSWQFPRALWFRLTLAGSLYITAKAKLRKDSSRHSKMSVGGTTAKPSAAVTALSGSPSTQSLHVRSSVCSAKEPAAKAYRVSVGKA